MKGGDAESQPQVADDVNRFPPSDSADYGPLALLRSCRGEGNLGRSGREATQQPLDSSPAGVGSDNPVYDKHPPITLLLAGLNW